MRGDLRRSAAGEHVVISMGRYCNIGENSIIRPPGKMYRGWVVNLAKSQPSTYTSFARRPVLSFHKANDADNSLSTP
mgnify:CR=1 FL=1